MPFALLLQTTTKPLIDAADLLAPWERLAFLEMQILERARSIFLVRWFGNATPIAGLSVSIAIANLDELRNRLSMVVTANRALGDPTPGAPGAGMLEPLAGLAGGLAGALFSPTGSMALGVVVARVKQTTLWIVVAVLNWLSYGLLGTAVGLLAAPFLAASLTLLSPAQLRLLVALGPLLIAARHFWDQLRGPRERLHPVVAAALDAGDAVAGLVPFLLAGFAIAVTRIGPELEPLSIQLILMVDLSRTMYGLFWFIVTDAVTRVTDTLTGRHGIGAALHGVFGALSSSFAHTGGWLAETWRNLVALMVADKAVVDAALSGWLVTARPQIRALTVENPLIGTIRAFGAQLGVVADVWAHSKRPTTSSSPSVLDVVLGAVLAAASKPGPPFPARPAIPSFPVTGSPAGLISDAARALISIDRLLPGAIPNPVALDEASWAALEAARRPGSVFAGRAAALRRSVPAAERARREQAERDFEAYGAIARRLVSPAAAAYMPRLDEILTKLHDEITGTRTRLPVRDLDDRPVMRPEIHRLRVRIGPGGDRASANAWVQMLRTRLDAHSLIRAVES